MVEVGSYNTAGDAQKVASDNGYAIVGDGFNGMVILDVSTPSSPTLVSTYSVPDGISYTENLEASNGYAYFNTDTNGVEIIDISNPSIPVQVAAFDNGGHASKLHN